MRRCSSKEPTQSGISRSIVFEAYSVMYDSGSVQYTKVMIPVGDDVDVVLLDERAREACLRVVVLHFIEF